MKKITLFTLFIAVLLFIGSIPANSQQIRIAETDTTSLMGPGSSAAIYTGGGRYHDAIWYFVISAIDTEVEVAMQAKQGKGSWVSIWADSLTYTANGSYGFEWDFAGLADSLRFTFISETGGSNAIITHHAALVGGN